VARRGGGSIRAQSQQFLARVSHELRTPLNSVLGFAKLLRRAEFSEAERGYLKQIVEEGEHLNLLVGDLLDSAQLMTGKMTLQREVCDLNALCQCIVEEQRPTLNPGVTLTTEFEMSLPKVWADRVRLRQAISNLLTNAAKYTPCGEIGLRTYARDSSVDVEICDTGIGIAQEQQGLIFLPFIQLDQQPLTTNPIY
jgi:signal transduction histidine kinase